MWNISGVFIPLRSQQICISMYRLVFSGISVLHLEFYLGLILAKIGKQMNFLLLNLLIKRFNRKFFKYYSVILQVPSVSNLCEVLWSSMDRKSKNIKIWCEPWLSFFLKYVSREICEQAAIAKRNSLYSILVGMPNFQRSYLLLWLEEIQWRLLWYIDKEERGGKGREKQRETEAEAKT